MRIQQSVLLIVLLSVTGAHAVTELEPYHAPPTRWWAGPDGHTLPFQTDEEVLEFLRTARVVSSKPIKKGINRPLKLRLEKDGIQAHAIFRNVDQSLTDDHWSRITFRTTLRDSFIFECAAYELGRLLGVHRIPPVVKRSFEGQRGSVQLWIENAMDEERRRRERLEPPSLTAWNREKIVRQVFDALIDNQDRNQGNILFDPEWNVWFIDHTRSFSRRADSELREKVFQCDRELWTTLRTIDRGLVEERLAPYLTGAELRSLFLRWDKLVKHIEDLIDQRGEGLVLVF